MSKPPRPENSVHPPLDFATARLEDFDGLELPAHDRGLLVIGPVGTGKTRLAAAIHHATAGERLFATAVVWAEAVWAERRKMRCSAFPREERLEIDRPYNPRFYQEPWVFEPRTILSRAHEAVLVTIDDYGTEEHAANRGLLFAILDDRIANGRPVTVTTNLSLESLRALDGRLFDRLRLLSLVRLVGASRRACA